jgi:hypothetical protein
VDLRRTELSLTIDEERRGSSLNTVAAPDLTRQSLF